MGRTTVHVKADFDLVLLAQNLAETLTADEMFEFIKNLDLNMYDSRFTVRLSHHFQDVVDAEMDSEAY